MSNIRKNEIIKNLKDFENRGFKDKLNKIYRRLPKMECEGCGICCYDSPICTYAEFLYIFDYFNNDSNFNYGERLEIYKKAFRENIMGFISNEMPCAFLNQHNRCLIHERAPLSCKFWGTKTDEEYDRDLNMDHDRNKKYKEHYAKMGIDIPDEVINFTTPNCKNVKIVSNPYNLNGKDFDRIIIDDLTKINRPYSNKNAPDWSISTYLLYYVFGEEVLKYRNKVIKEYQSGNANAVEEYINKIDFEKYI